MLSLPHRAVAVLVLAALLAGACAPADPLGLSASPVVSPDARPTAYALRPGDRLRLIVFGENDLSGEFVVTDSGTLAYPLVGNLQAAGRTVDDVREDVAARLRDGYLLNPRVAVEVLSYPPVLVEGEVKNGGAVLFRPGMNASDAIALAGGYSYRANKRYVTIRRAGADREERVSLERPAELGPGDFVRVPERFF